MKIGDILLGVMACPNCKTMADFFPTALKDPPTVRIECDECDRTIYGNPPFGFWRAYERKKTRSSIRDS